MCGNDVGRYGGRGNGIDRPVADPETAAAFAKYTIFNRGKKSVALNLKDTDAIDALLKLIDTADVLIEGFRPGVMERLGLGPEVCCERNSKLVYGRMTGWGQTGPLSHAAGHDPNYIALTGALWAGGSHEHRPTAPLTLIGDLGGGTMMLVFGVLSAIIHAQKTGEGQVVDAAITDGAAYISTLLWGMHNSGQMTDVPGSGWADFGSPWHDTYLCSDGEYITVCALEPQFYALLIDGLNLNDDPMFANQWDKEQWQAARKSSVVFSPLRPVKSGVINSKEPMFVSHPFLIFQKRLSIRITSLVRPFLREMGLPNQARRRS